MVDKELLTPGTRVKIIDSWCEGCHQNLDGQMDKWLGQVMTVNSFHMGDFDGSYIYLEEDDGDGVHDGHWRWFLPAIECIVDESEDEVFEFPADVTTLFA